MCCGQSPGPPFGAEPAGSSRLVLVRCGETQGTEEGRLLGTLDSPLSPLGDVHGNKAGEFLMDLQVPLPAVGSQHDCRGMLCVCCSLMLPQQGAILTVLRICGC